MIDRVNNPRSFLEHLFSILLIALILAVFAPLLLIAILSGNPFVSSARAKNFVAAALFRRLDSMNSSVLPYLSMDQRPVMH